MNWQPNPLSPDTPEPPIPTPEPPVELSDSDALAAPESVAELVAQDPLVEAPVPEVLADEVVIAPPDAPAVQVDEVAVELLEAPTEVPAVPRGTVHHFEPGSRRPIDKFIASCMNDIGRLVGTNINAGRRGAQITITGVSPAGVQRATAKGDTTDIPIAALEWAIKQLYWNGELTRSKMTESYKENGSTVASGVFQILGNCKWFEATESPLTLHFYRLQWEQENAD